MLALLFMNVRPLVGELDPRLENNGICDRVLPDGAVVPIIG
jgi:hypothetical protein